MEKRETRKIIGIFWRELKVRGSVSTVALRRCDLGSLKHSGSSLKFYVLFILSQTLASHLDVYASLPTGWVHKRDYMFHLWDDRPERTKTQLIF